MIHRDDEMALLNGVLRGRVGRRDLLRRAAALGLGAPVVSGLLGVPSPSALAHQEGGTPAAGATCIGFHHLGAGVRPGQSHPLRGCLHVQHVGQGVHVRLPPRVGPRSADPARARRVVRGERGRHELHLHPAPGRALSQRPGDDGEGRQVLLRDGAQAARAGDRGRLPGEHRQRRGGRRLHRHDHHVETRSDASPACWPGRATPRSCRRGSATRSTGSARGSAPGRTGWSSSSPTTASSTPATRTTGSRGSPVSGTSRSRCCQTSSLGSPRSRSGEIDGGTLTADVARTLENDESLQILEGLFAAPRVIQFNTTEDVPWRDARVRQAINLAIDRQEIIDNVYGGSAAADRRHCAGLRRLAALRGRAAGALHAQRRAGDGVDGGGWFRGAASTSPCRRSPLPAITPRSPRSCASG